MALIKKLTGAVVAMALVIMVTVVTFAFKGSEKYSQNLAKKASWFRWEPVNSSTDTSDPANYQPGNPGCEEGTELCAVFAESIEDINDPSLQAEINDALTNPATYSGTRIQLKE